MEELTINTLLTQLNICNQKIHEFKQNITNENIIVVVGNTRKGKSTLINYIQENNLIGVESFKRFVIETDGLRGPSVKHGSLSHTKFPSIWKSTRYSNTLIVDFPGFEDNRGSLLNIINTVFLNQLKFANSVKFVVVCNINDLLNDNISEFTKVMKIMEASSHDLNAISLILTKDFSNNSVENIVSIIQTKILDVPQIVVNRNLIARLVGNIEKIGIFRMPSRSGVLSDEIVYNIHGAISSSTFSKFTGKFTTVDSARCCLLSLYNKVVGEIDFNDELSKVIKAYENWFSIDKYVFASIEEELNTIKELLGSLLRRIEHEESLDLVTVNLLYISILNLIPQGLSEKFENAIMFFQTMDELSLLDCCIKQSLVRQYKRILNGFKQQILKLIAKIEAELVARREETIQAKIAAINVDIRKSIVVGTALLPTIKPVLEMLGYNLEGFSYEMLKIPQVACALAVAGVGAVAGGYLTHYYQTVLLRQQLRKEQGRS